MLNAKTLQKIEKWRTEHINLPVFSTKIIEVKVEDFCVVLNRNLQRKQRTQWQLFASCACECEVPGGGCCA